MLDLRIHPAPPMAHEDLPHVGAGIRFLEGPTDYLIELRERYGDTFFVDVFGFPLLVTFSPKGLESLYALEESDASFGLATFDLASFKTPTEIFADADPALFYELMKHERMADYLRIIADVSAEMLAGWDISNPTDVFDAIRTTSQRIGYGLWICREAAAEPYWRRLKVAFDVLDQERSFVNPQETLATIKSGKARERAAVEDIKALLAEIAVTHDANPAKEEATIDRLRERFGADEDGARKLAHNTINANQGFLSNLYAAIGWVVLRLAQYPELRAKADAEIAKQSAAFPAGVETSGDALNKMTFIEQLMMECVRIAQRSITLRRVLKPVQFDDGAHVYDVPVGIYITTMLSVTNTQTEELRRFDPDHYVRNALPQSLTPLGKETVSTFGHGKHACPAQRFSHHMCKIVVAGILDRFAMEPLFSDPQPSSRQLGGVARPEATMRIQFRRL
jgi:cytochrome P450